METAQASFDHLFRENPMRKAGKAARGSFTFDARNSRAVLFHFKRN
jgi:hypothetical protein